VTELVEEHQIAGLSSFRETGTPNLYCWAALWGIAMPASA